MHTARILIVDDHIVFRQELKAILAGTPGLQIVGEAADGVEALARAKEVKPDVVVMDLRMPHMNGIEATSRLKAEMPHLVVVMLSICESEQYRQVALTSGADDYVHKSAVLDDLVPAICRCLQARQPGTKVARSWVAPTAERRSTVNPAPQDRRHSHREYLSSCWLVA